MFKYNGWVKYFADGTKEEGYDYLVQAKKASWSKGRLDGIIAVSLTHDGTTVMVRATGTWWQEDVFEAVVGENGGKIVERRLFKDIVENDKFQCWQDVGDQNFIWTISDVAVAADIVKEIDPHHHDAQGFLYIGTDENGKTYVKMGARKH